MYRDFLARSASGRSPEMSIERAIDDQRLMDQIYASLAAVTERTSTSSSSAAAPAAARWRRRWPAPARASSSSSAAISCRRKRRTGSGGGLEGPALPHARAWLDERGERVPALHALQRRRQHEVLGQRALPAAPRGLSGDCSTPTACRRRGRSTTRRWRRTTIAPSGCTSVHGALGDDPTEPPRGPYPFPPVPHAPGMAQIAERLRAQGLHPSSLPLGLIDVPARLAAAACATPAIRSPCRIAREERRRRDRASGRAVRRAERHAVDQRARPAADHRSVRAARRGRRGRAQRRDRARRRRRPSSCSCGAVNSAALLLRSASDRASRRPGEFVRTGRRAATWRTCRRCSKACTGG